jgi:CHAT domain-containing protein/tetratricopeptide (TPR) repeat protein
MDRIKVQIGYVSRMLSTLNMSTLMFCLVLLLGSSRAIRSQESNAEKYPPGLIVTDVTKGSPAEQASIKVGDVLLSFNGQPVRFESQIGPYRDKALWDGRNTVELSVRRGANSLTLSLTLSAVVGFSARPPLSSPAEKLYDEAITMLKAKSSDGADKLLAAAIAAEMAGDDRAAAWIWTSVSKQSQLGSKPNHDALNSALAEAEKCSDELSEASLLISLGMAANDRGRADAAGAFYRRALSIAERLAPNSLLLAADVNNLGVLAADLGKMDEAESLHTRSLSIRQRLAPESLDVAGSLNNLGDIAREGGRLVEAEALFKHSMAIRERLAPFSLEIVTSLTNLGAVARDRGILDAADAQFRRALTITERLAPESIYLANSLSNLGVLAADRGRLDEAERLLSRSLTITERLAPDSLDLAISLNDLGAVTSDRGMLDEAEALLSRSETITERLAPNSLDLARSLNNLSNIAYKRGDLDNARVLLDRSVRMTEQLAPDSIELAESLSNLGVLDVEQGRIDEAEKVHRRALQIKERIAPDSLDLADSLGNLGNVAFRRGDMNVAELLYRRALGITERLAPDSLDLAQCLNSLGNVSAYRKRLGEAEDRYRRAWKIVQSQGMQVAGDNGRQEFGTVHSKYAADLIAIQLKRHESNGAFVTLEEGRARALAQVMAERGVTERVTPPAVWSAYNKVRTAFNVAYKDAERAHMPVETAKTALLISKKQNDIKATLEQKQRVVDEAEKRFEPKRAEVMRTRLEMENCWAAVLRSAKAAIPAQIDPRAARKRLSPGTLFLEFSVSDRDVMLFAATSKSTKGIVLPTKRAELQDLVAKACGMASGDIDQPRTSVVSRDRKSPTRGPVFAEQKRIGPSSLRSLFRKLFPAEVQEEILQSKHIVISPVDFLWDLPFAALITSAAGKPAFLGLQKPISYAQSLTILVTPEPPRGSPASDALVVGNPIYDNSRRPGFLAIAEKVVVPPTSAGNAKLASLHGRGELGMMTINGTVPNQLPGAEKEAERVASLYHTVAHIGIEPTEAWFRTHATTAKVIHLATHGFLHPYSPQSSGVLFAIPEKSPPADQYDNDGVLQAWEVWSLKLNADLVVLSACETGRGAKVKGEGLIGLTRAFQYAGAKTIVSSQWQVNDQSTAVLMTAFHKHLIAGVDRDEALRLAMCEVANNKASGWSAPYHWAAFVMVGETGKMP